MVFVVWVVGLRSRYVPAANVARATRSVLSLVSSERVEVGEAQQAKRRATASNEHRLIVLAPASQSQPELGGNQIGETQQSKPQRRRL